MCFKTGTVYTLNTDASTMQNSNHMLGLGIEVIGNGGEYGEL